VKFKSRALIPTKPPHSKHESHSSRIFFRCRGLDVFAMESCLTHHCEIHCYTCSEPDPGLLVAAETLYAEAYVRLMPAYRYIFFSENSSNYFITGPFYCSSLVLDTNKIVVRLVLTANSYNLIQIHAFPTFSHLIHRPQTQCESGNAGLSTAAYNLFTSLL